MSGDPFSIEIDKNASVDELRSMIMHNNSHAFADVDARQIMLWKVSGGMFLFLMPFKLIRLASSMKRSQQILLKLSSSIWRMLISRQ
jgi:hypothetical protein